MGLFLGVCIDSGDILGLAAASAIEANVKPQRDSDSCQAYLSSRCEPRALYKIGKSTLVSTNDVQLRGGKEFAQLRPFCDSPFISHLRKEISADLPHNKL